MVWFPAPHVQQIIQNTGGVLVEYRGQEGYFHCENPSYEDIHQGFASVQGLVKVLVGDTRVFPNLEANTLITVGGADYLVAEWMTPGDGDTVYIALKTSTRT